MLVDNLVHAISRASKRAAKLPGRCNILPARRSDDSCFSSINQYFMKSKALQSRLILASSSRFRRALLERLGLDFRCRSPDLDESPLPGEAASTYVCRLAEAKARAIAVTEPSALVVGADQCALLDGDLLGKPGSHARALEQLVRAQGKTVVFHTGLCLLGIEAGIERVEDVVFEVDFRELDEARLDAYLRREQPYDCAGSFKAEGLGIALFERLRGDDPTALIGLPLIRLVAMLESAGVEILRAGAQPSA